MEQLIYIVPFLGLLALLYSVIKNSWISKQSTGTEKMTKISKNIQDGAIAFLKTEYKVLAIFVVAVALLLGFSNAGRADSSWMIAVSFVIGAFSSALAGYLGMIAATKSNVRTTQAARAGLAPALKIAFTGGSIMGMNVVGLAAVGLSALFIFYSNYDWDVYKVINVLSGFSLGASSIALFARVGGGIYTKAADVGADLAGKVYEGIPEDDPRNAAAIADLVGDNVGDFSGMAEDVFESYEVTIVSAMILGLAVMQVDPTQSLKWIVFPLLVRAIGVFSSIIGTYAVSLWPTKGDAFRAMDLSYDLSSIISTISFFFLAVYYAHDLRLFAATASGILLAVGFNKYTALFTERETPSVNRLVRSAKTGEATIILAGLAIGYESTVWAAMIIVLSIILAVGIYSVAIPATLVPIIIGASIVIGVVLGIYLAIKSKKIENGIFAGIGVLVLGLIVSSFEPAPAGHEFIFIMYSIALAGIGMLSHTGNNLAMDAFGPLADNAGGIAEMAKEDFKDPESQRTLATLDSVGNTTKAITKGIAIASAVIAALSLFASFIEVTGLETEGLNIADPMVFVGLLIGGSLPFLFSSILLRAVERAAGLIIEEVRKQFRIPGVMEGTVKPAYDVVVRICTIAAQRELIVVAMLGILVPIIVGFLIGVRALGGFLAGIIVTGQLLAVFMANAGGAWDNAKKQIEDEPSDPENNLGKFSDRHKASVIGDTVGDPLKDTAGPALNPMIKVVNLVSLLVAPLVISVAATGGSMKTIAMIIAGTCLLALMVGIGFSLRDGKYLIE